jgi:hypothetical protein
MRHSLSRKAAFRRAVAPVAVAATVAALAAGTGAAVPAGAVATRAPGARAVRAAPAVPASPATASGPPRTVLLITGARLVTGLAGGARALGLLPGAGGRLASAMLSLGLGRTAFEIPQVALPYLGHGLAPGLFELSSLLRAETGGRLPVTVDYRGRAPSLPGVRITHASDGTARGYLTLAGGRAFGAALARQFAADHARGSYGQDGLFAGGVSIGLAGSGVPAARTPAFPMRTLTVTATNQAGKPDTGDMVIVFSADNASRFADPIASMNVFRKGVTKFSVPAGHYWAIGDFVTFTRTSGAERFDVLPQFTALADATVHVSARAADSEIHVVTPRPAVLGYSTIDFLRPTAAGNSESVSFSDNFPAFVSPTTRRPTVGKLAVFTLVQLQSPAKAAGIPYQYNVGYGDTSGLIPPQHHVVHQASLATVTARYYSDVAGTGGLYRTGLFRAEGGGFAVAINRISVPMVETEYTSGNPAILWFDSYSQSYQNLAGGQSDDARTFHAGERLTENWNAYPLHEGANADLAGAANPSPWVPSASRAGDRLTLDVTPFSDNTPGHGGNGGFYGGQFGPVDHIRGHYGIEENGTTIAAGNPLKGAKEIGPYGEFDTRVTLSPHPGTVRFVLDASGAGKIFALSTASRTVWTWRSRHESGGRLPAGWTCVPSLGILHPDRACAAEPMMTLNYAVRGLSLRGSAAPGRQVVHVTAGHLQLVKAIPVTSASVSVSVNGGRTWHQAKITGHDGSYTATFTAPAGVQVSLRTGATDAAGGAITETLINAYQTSS